MKVVSVNIGELTTVQWRKKTIDTGIFKYPVNHPIFLDVENVRGDSIENRVHHGGVDQAVYAYGEQHYQFWKERYPDQDWKYGMFGENLTISEFDEVDIHVGSIYQLGTTKIEVTKPRQPCMKLGIRFNDQKIVKDFWNSTKSGVYFKILETGSVEVGDELILLENQIDNLTIAKVYTAKRLEKGK
ncbi:MAG: MOSC domain-containing protein [Flavobacteriaceae bacterium]|nr:MOSC domain-containing protein [Flavobacteriaceae bacterium]